MEKIIIANTISDDRMAISDACAIANKFKYFTRF